MTKEEFERIQREEAEKERERKEKMNEETDKILNDRLPGWDEKSDEPCRRCGGTGYISYMPMKECPMCNPILFFK